MCLIKEWNELFVYTTKDHENTEAVAFIGKDVAGFCSIVENERGKEYLVYE